VSLAPAVLATVELEPGTLVIADLHLDVGPAGAGNERFITFLRALRGVPRLLILGDLFDAWIGPAQAALPAAAEVIVALADAVHHGTAVDVLHGNRDFLLESRFEALSGAVVRPDGFIGLAGGERVLFVHGDELCTLDRRYQRMKRVLRSAPMLWAVPRIPTPVALGIARRLRRASVQAVAAKTEAEKEQQPNEAVRMARAAGCTTIVCGHAHRFRDERVDSVRWIVLDAFGGKRDLLRIGPGGSIEASSSTRA